MYANVIEDIRVIRPFAFRGLGKLQELSLQNTPLDRLAQFAFSGLHNMTNLYLANNQIRRIEKYAFAGTSSIRLLVLTNNPTLRIDSAAFSGLIPSIYHSNQSVMTNQSLSLADDSWDHSSGILLGFFMDSLSLW